MRHAFFLVPFALLAATPALALSCLAPDIIRDYTHARDSDDLYSMVIGQIAADPAIEVPEAGGHSAKADTRVRLTGRGLTQTGFTAPFEGEIIVRTSCFSAWCAAAPATDTQVFTLLRHSGDDLILELSPCPGGALPWSADDEARVLNCHRFDKCAIVE